MTLPLLAVRIQLEHDIVAARQRTRQLAEALGFDAQQQTRLATAVSEIARNAFSYAGGGRVEFSLEGSTPPQLLQVRVSDHGSGIPNLSEILEGRYRSSTGMGMGIIGAQRLMDQFRIVSSATGSIITMGKLLPRAAPLIVGSSLPQLLERMEKQRPKSLIDEFRDQNRELLHTLDELRRRQDELVSLNRELEDTNRGVVALYAELDERADSLRRADEVKSKFLSNMSHEFRTPLNSILALSRLLLDRADGDLTSEQELQVTFIRKSAESLSELVNDLLDLAKVEAGKTEIRPGAFEASELFGALRGMLRPLLLTTALNLVFDEPTDIPTLFSDEGKISQILRNFISNALKFTESGEVRIWAEHHPESDEVSFHVRDTGIGIPAAHLQTIFLEFAQLDSPLQRKYKGTGLGLPLSRKLAELLGGGVRVESQPGVGSTFSLTLPREFSRREAPVPLPEPETAPGRDKVLLVEDHFETRLAYEKYLRHTAWQVVSARSVREAEGVLRMAHPRAIVLDISLTGEDTWDFLARTKTNPATSGIPVIVATSVDDRSKAFALGADEYLEKPVSGEALRETLAKLAPSRKTVLIVDDEDVSRYLARQLFDGSGVNFFEARDGAEAIALARERNPDLIVMDLAMPGMNGFQALEAIRADVALASIPAVIVTSKKLSAAEKTSLREKSLAVIAKAELLSAETALMLQDSLRKAGVDLPIASAKTHS